MSSSDSDNGGWILILFLILFLGPCQATNRNKSDIDDNERDIQALEQENERLEGRIKELEEWKESR